MYVARGEKTKHSTKTGGCVKETASKGNTEENMKSEGKLKAKEHDIMKLN